ncbi:twin-arginine translocase subunit TatC [Natronobacterium texcoconense]|uniref:Sec-independent protein translocase protein TatC n=1 Tax=Natronobacterium texcoconense TaxID=1095778 RepID=A0A1H1HQJ3_NATTX|nr:twin-arginine translocase subunit TatC [Natronobacterium texcoconense]SDR27316.1 sec-independent protein translocase protein TatC [Natronobacterium texcoconense]
MADEPGDDEAVRESEESRLRPSDESDADADSNADDDLESEPESAPESDTTTDDESVDTADDPPVETDGEGAVGDRHEPGAGPEEYPDYPDPDDDVGGISTPPDDEEMPLADHIEEMVLRLAVVLLFGAAGTAIGLLWASQAIEHIWFNIFPYDIEQVPPPHVYHPLELWLTRIKVSALLGIMVALPAFVYECYLFMKPGLYPNERKYYLAAVPTSVVLAAVGMLFSYVLVLPILFEYFTFYAEGSADIAYALGDTFDLIITLIGFLAIVFQIPLFIMLAIMMGVTTRRWLAQKRLYFWAAFAGLAFMFTMDPTMMAPVLVAITMILLFEGTLAILKWVGRE